MEILKRAPKKQCSIPNIVELSIIFLIISVDQKNALTSNHPAIVFLKINIFIHPHKHKEVRIRVADVHIIINNISIILIIIMIDLCMAP